MKVALTLLLSLNCWLCVAQSVFSLPIDKQTHRITYSAEVPLIQVTQQELIARVQLWAANTCATSAPASDGTQGTVIIPLTATQQLIYTYAGKSAVLTLQYTAIVALQDKQYRYQLTNFVFLYPNGNAMPSEGYLTQVVDPGTETNARFLLSLRSGFDEAIRSIKTSLQATVSKTSVQK